MTLSPARDEALQRRILAAARIATGVMLIFLGQYKIAGAFFPTLFRTFLVRSRRNR